MIASLLLALHVRVVGQRLQLVVEVTHLFRMRHFGVCRVHLLQQLELFVQDVDLLIQLRVLGLQLLNAVKCLRGSLFGLRARLLHGLVVSFSATLIQ